MLPMSKKAQVFLGRRIPDKKVENDW